MLKLWYGTILQHQQWTKSNAALIREFFDVLPGTYTITVTDANGLY
jgi:hypothetical protein